MFRRYFSYLLLTVFSLLSVAAEPQQAEGALEIPWWVWLIVIAVFLLITFIVLITLDWGGADGRDRDDDKRR